jgi:mono/diheme cytochrome c family protein
LFLEVGALMKWFLSAALVVLCSPVLAVAAEVVPSYTKDIKPLMERYCVSCHKPGKAKGRLDVSTFQAIMKGGKKKAVVPGKPDASWLQLTMEGRRPVMPPRKEKQMKAQEIALVRAWILAGARNDAPAVAAPR